jgi:hypothetical protein
MGRNRTPRYPASNPVDFRATRRNTVSLYPERDLNSHASFKAGDFENSTPSLASRPSPPESAGHYRAESATGRQGRVTRKVTRLKPLLFRECERLELHTKETQK